MTGSPAMNVSALEGLRVIDLSGNLAGAYCTQLLAGFGAEVILVEPPRGHSLRHRMPFAGGEEDVEKSIAFLWFGQGKKSVTADPETEAGRARVLEWIRSADVVVDSYSLEQRKKVGLGFEALQAVKPDLIQVSITSFGLSGPYRDFEAEEITIEALSGQMFGTGTPHRSPLTAGPPVAQVTAGLHAYLGTLMALRLRNRNGLPRLVEVSIHEAGVENMELRAFAHWRKKENPTRAELAVPAIVPWKSYPCRDGWAAIHGAPFRRWGHLARLLPGGRILAFLYARGISNLERRDSENAGSPGKPRSGRLKRQFFKLVDARVGRWAAGKTRAEILVLAAEKKLAMGVLRSLEEIIDLPQHEMRGFFQIVDHPLVGSHRTCGAPFPMSGTPWKSKSAPLLGEHNDIPIPLPEKQVPESVPDERLPLSGIRVIDLTLVEVAPHGTRILADFGAEVIKVEYPARLDLFRGTEMSNHAYDRQPFWPQLNRNKRSITLDLKAKDGHAAFRRLVAESDVVVVNFRGGVLERLGIDYDILKTIKPDIILVSMPGYGDSGRDSELPAFGGIIEVMSGVQNLTQYPGSDKTERIREIDIINGVAGTAAVLTALTHRDRTGEGQSVALSQMETTTHALMGETLLETILTGTNTPPTGNRSSRHAPQGCFPCRGEDRWLTLSIRSDDEFKRLCQLIGRTDWIEDPRFSSFENRREHHDELDQGIEVWSGGYDPREAMELLQKEGIAAGAVSSLQEVASDPHLGERGWFFGTQNQPETFFMGLPFTISGVSPGHPTPGPALGEGNADIFGTLLRIPEAEQPKLNPEEIRSAFHPEP